MPKNSTDLPEITDRQREILMEILATFKQEKRYPTLYELAKKMGVRSKNHYPLIKPLVKKGYIDAPEVKRGQGWRTYKITRAGLTYLEEEEGQSIPIALVQ